MGLKNNSHFQPPNYFHRLSKALQFAFSEWMLMLLLFIDACFTYLIAKFASYCQLQHPCVLCSRHDHVLAKDKTGIYWDSICNHHKSEISSLVLSNVNEKMGSANLIHSHVSESLIINDEHTKNEKNIFVDESLESCKSLHIEKNITTHSPEFECQKDDVNSSNELELPVSDIVPEVHLKSDSQFEISDIRNDSETVSTRDIDEVKCQNEEIKEDVSRINEPVSFDEVLSSNNAKSLADDFLESMIKEPATTNGHQTSNQLDLGDAYKLAISTKGRQLSGKLLDQKSFNNSSSRISDDLKILLSNRSNDSLISPKLISPKVSFNSDELTSLQFLQSRFSLERNESNISLDGSVVSEIEGEGVVDRLRRQVEHDKKLMGVLYKELEEERNASAVATNQAMAMITRLQEEKAALYTEALQSLRMMEEQAEYDNEALQKANDIIEEKDKQIRELEELFRKTTEDVRE
ncbi:putative myosin-binding protein 5 [Bidens hawaiensis]|uniref:putative myosin-binding protein 5 n=1 Tax=Bidens hawaiensis TaxID=980011 RepID=UPI0040497839